MYLYLLIYFFYTSQLLRCLNVTDNVIKERQSNPLALG